ncbi:MAG: TonB-dependent receptor [candidate division KSB1 bacterium]|nr:TonB-dependent receptor [candidate division KSB1 bacterium]
MRSLFRAWAMAFAVAWSGLALAGTTGKIAGRVTDARTGEPLPGVNVILENTQMGAATDENGEYFIINVPPGTYSVVARMIGYVPKRYERVRVSVDLTTQLDFQLEPTVIEVEKPVVVVAQRVIQKDLTSSEVSISSERIEELPVRSVTELLDLQAGVVRDAAGELHIRGGRTNEIVYLVDGVQVINPLDRRSGITIDDQAIEELKVITGTFNAEYGQALSGVVNIVTKKGTDRFTANARAYFGDYLSFDDDLYYVMDNAEWAQAAARSLNTKSRYLRYDLRPYLQKAGGDWQALLAEKPWLKKKPYLNSYNPLTTRDLQVNLSGPMPGLKRRVSYFLSGRYQYSPGYTYGKRYFMPWGFQAPISDTLHTFPKADNELVPLGWYEGISTQSKVYLRASNNLDLSYGIYYNHDYSYGCDYRFKYVPDAGRYYFTDRYLHILSGTYVFSPRTFLDFKLNYYLSRHKNYLYEDPYDYRYMPTNSGDFEQYVFRPTREQDIAVSSQANDFAYWGNDVGRTVSETQYESFKADLTTQVTNRHLVKTGVSGTFHDLTNDYYTLQFSQATYRPIVPDTISPFRTRYHARPKEFAAYIQDKIEFRELIINVGLRYDYFYSDGRLLADPMDPQVYSPFKMDHIYRNYSPTVPDSELVPYTLEERLKFWYKRPAAKWQLSPRVGLSFPITATGVIHFSYGHFFQNPEFRYLFENPHFWVTGAGAQNLVGNADLKPERTVMYEIGLQQQLTEGLYLHLTGFYRDIRDWVGTGFPTDTYRGITYYRFVNRDHARAKGVTLSAAYTRKALTVNVDYSYMIAKGTSSDPRDAYNDLQSNRAPRVQLIDLDWDRRHSLDLVATYRSGPWTVTVLGGVNSGLPYTPEFIRGEAAGGSAYVGLRENSERIPTAYNVDLRIARFFRLKQVRLLAFVNVRNLFDIRNAQSVYADTGRPDFTLQSYMHRNRLLEISSIDEYYARPGMFSPPRFIQLGLEINYGE